MTNHEDKITGLVAPNLPLGSTAIGEEDAGRELLQLSIAAAGIGTFDWDLVNGTLAWDDRLIELFGYDTESFDQTIEAFNSRLHPEDLARVSADLQSAINSCGEFSSEYRVLLPNGSLRWVGAKGRALCSEDGVAVRMLGAAYDITVREESELRLSRIIESMATAFFSLDHDWNFNYLNAEAENVLGRTRSELKGANIWEAFPAAVGSDFETNYRRAMKYKESVTFDAYYPAPLDKWFEVRAHPSDQGLSVYFVDITVRRKAQQQTADSVARAELLSRITEELTGTLDMTDAVHRLSRLVVPTLADWCVVTLLDDEDQPGNRHGLSDAGGWHKDPELRELVQEYANKRLAHIKDDNILVQAMKTAEPQFIRSDATPVVAGLYEAGELRDMIETLAPESVAILPLKGRRGAVGLLALCNGAERGAFSISDMATASHVAGRAGLALDNARLYRQQRELAEALQRALLTAPPEPDHVQIAVRYVPAAETAQVGGDWYDAFMQPNGASIVVIGDVIGHDTQAAAAMGQIRSIVRTLGAIDDENPASILSSSDKVMQTLQIDTTATAAVARFEQSLDELDRGITRMRWSNAGHPPPMVLHADGTAQFLDQPVKDLLLGIDPHADRSQYEVVLDRDAVVLFYTDGLVERRSEALEDGFNRLLGILSSLQGHDLETLCDEVIAGMLPDTVEDDVALIAVKLHRQDRPRPDEAGPNDVPRNVPEAPKPLT